MGADSEIPGPTGATGATGPTGATGATSASQTTITATGPTNWNKVAGCSMCRVQLWGAGGSGYSEAVLAKKYQAYFERLATLWGKGWYAMPTEKAA